MTDMARVNITSLDTMLTGRAYRRSLAGNIKNINVADVWASQPVTSCS